MLAWCAVQKTNTTVVPFLHTASWFGAVFQPLPLGISKIDGIFFSIQLLSNDCDS